MKTGHAALLPGRAAGVLLHPTSLPGGPGNGDLGADAFRFVDFLRDAGCSVWQILPHGPTHDDLSPYQCLSVHAGNPLWISIDRLQQEGWLSQPDIDAIPSMVPFHWRRLCINKAHENFQNNAGADAHEAYQKFIEEHSAWLEDFTLFTVLRRENGYQPWHQWPEKLRQRDADTLRAAGRQLARNMSRVRFEQFLFYRQWTRLKRHAAERGVRLFGDMPIYVALDSADVWANRDCFLLDEHGYPQKVAGVPPDYFSVTGQRWGNPLYDWERLAATDYAWWRQRFRSYFDMYDLVRIDHFRGLQAYWAIPADEATARNGAWLEAPGSDLFRALQREFGRLPVIAENLGYITPEVEALRKSFDFPGMHVLQFAFSGDADNPHLPANHEENAVVYTGTHDNDTTSGWFSHLTRKEQDKVMRMLGHDDERMPWRMIHAALESKARLAIVPMQDLLGLGSRDRMNTPGTTVGNWQWRFDWSAVDEHLPVRLRDLVVQYHRLVEQ